MIGSQFCKSKRWWRAENGKNAYLSPTTIKHVYQKLLQVALSVLYLK